jgi:SAM-dependent methyltransferase
MAIFKVLQHSSPALSVLQREMLLGRVTTQRSSDSRLQHVVTNVLSPPYISTPQISILPFPHTRPSSFKVISLNLKHSMATSNQSSSLPPASQSPDWDSFWADKKTTWDRGGSNPAFIDFLRDPSNPPISTDANPTPGAPEPGVYEHTEEIRLPVPVKEDGTRRKALVPGCGTGYDVALLASWGYDAYGLEISKHAIDEANAYLKHSRERVSEGEYSVKDEKFGQGSVQCLLGDYFDHAWVREAGSVEGFDLIYDHTVRCPQVEMLSRERMLIFCLVLVRPSAFAPSTLGSTDKVFTFCYRYPRLHGISHAQACICGWPAMVAPAYRSCGATQATRGGTDI